MYRTVLLAALVAVAAGQLTPRTKMCQKAVALGLTFYKAVELETIILCGEPTIFANPNDTDALIAKVKDCVIQNSGSKAAQALALLNQGNTCMKPDDMITMLTRNAPFLLKIVDPLVTLALKAMNECKKNNKLTGAKKTDACMNKVYNATLPGVTRPFINTVFTKLAPKMNKKDWDCGKQLAPKIVNVTGYSAYNIVKKA